MNTIINDSKLNNNISFAPLSRISVKETLISSIDSVCSCISLFSENPTKNYTRNRKLSAFALMQFILNMEGNSLDARVFDS